MSQNLGELDDHSTDNWGNFLKEILIPTKWRLTNAKFGKTKVIKIMSAEVNQ